MKQPIALTVILLVIFLSLGADSEEPRGVFSSLHVGQKVNLKEEGQGFTISFFEKEIPQTHKVLEIGKDFIVLESVAGMEVTIPVYAVNSVVKMKGR